MSVIVSIIIPCFNQGHFLKDALDSIVATGANNNEVIIINDGSTDEFTNQYTRELSELGWQVVFQENKGLASARNIAIERAKGQFILPLDADNKIFAPYLTKAVELLKADENIAVVYGNAQFFGDKNELVQVGDYNLQRLMLHNYIDACALIRKSALLQVGSYDTTNKLFGLEDWDLWLRLSFSGFGFHYLNETCFNYRVHELAMSKGGITLYKNLNKVENDINLKYPNYMGHQWITINFLKRFKKSPFQILIKIFLAAYFPKSYNKLLMKNKIRNGI